MTTKSVNLAILGSGVVGTAYINQLRNLKFPILFDVIYFARSSKEALYNKDYKPISLDTYKTVEPKAILSLNDLLEYLKVSGKPTILVDNTSNTSVADSYSKFVKEGISIATPNKKAFSSSLNEWDEIFKNSETPGGGLVYHESTVGAGLPIIGPLKDMITTNDKIEKIEGIFSGTLSYIFNEFSAANSTKEARFSDIVKVAKSLGYTEPDPRDDLNGLDVARKVTILARISGLKVESPTSFPIQSLIPEQLKSVTDADQFLSKLPDFDGEIQKLNEEALAENKVLRFVGLCDVKNQKTSVQIEKYGFDHPFASLKGSDNVIAIKSERYSNPLIIQGAGAGADVTAHGVLSDTIKIAERIAK